MTAERAAGRRADVVGAADIDPVLWDMNSELLSLRRQLAELRLTLEEREQKLGEVKQGGEGSERAVSTLKGVLTDMVLKGRTELQAARDEATRAMAERLAAAQAEADLLVADAAAALTTALGRRTEDAPSAPRRQAEAPSPPPAARRWPADVPPAAPPASTPADVPPTAPLASTPADVPPTAPLAFSEMPPPAPHWPADPLPAPTTTSPSSSSWAADALSDPWPWPTDGQSAEAPPWPSDPDPGAIPPSPGWDSERSPAPSQPLPPLPPPAMGHPVSNPEWSADQTGIPSFPAGPPPAYSPAPMVDEETVARWSAGPRSSVAMNGWTAPPGSVQTLDYDLKERFEMVIGLKANSDFRTPPRGVPAVPGPLAPDLTRAPAPVRGEARPPAAAPAPSPSEEAFNDFWPPSGAAPSGSMSVDPSGGRLHFSLIDALLPIIALTLVLIVVLSWLL